MSADANTNVWKSILLSLLGSIHFKKNSFLYIFSVIKDSKKISWKEEFTGLKVCDTNLWDFF